MSSPAPGKPPNPLRPLYPRLLTFSPLENEARRAASTKNYDCRGINPPIHPNGGQGLQPWDRDEYPQAMFVENFYSAHIKCINARENSGSGSTIRQQIARWKPKPSVYPSYPLPPYFNIATNDIIELIVLP
jgi:Deoxyribonuclease NucA/NucB